MTKDEALKLALEAAYLAGFDASGEGYNAEYPFGDHKKDPEQDAAWVKDRDNALRQALAQQEQEPVAWKETDEVECPVCQERGFPWPECGHITYLERTTPPQRTWVGLTEEDLKLLSAEWRIVYGAWLDDFARDIEAKLRSKNT